MKKVLALVLAVILVMGLAVPAAANNIVSASVRNSRPDLTNSSEKLVKLHNLDEVLKLSEEIQNLMSEAEEALKDVDFKGLALRYFFYTEILSGENSVSVDLKPIPHKTILIMQYIDGMWVELEHSVGDDGIITVPDVVDAPFIILTEALASPGASWKNLVPVLTEESYVIVQLHTLEEVETLSEEIQNRMAEASDELKDACPKGFAVKYFFEMEILGTEKAVSVDFEPIAHSEIVFKQYVDGAWVELEFSIDDNGIITVSGVVEGPVAIFTK